MRTPVLTLLCLLLAWSVARLVNAQPQDVSAKGIDLPYLNGTNLQAHFTADTGDLLPGGYILASNFTMFTYGKGGTNNPELIVRAPVCIFDRTSRQAWSTGRIEVVSVTTNFFLEGRSFFCQQSRSNASLVVSNDVHTVIPMTNAPLHVRSERFNFEQEMNDAGEQRKATYTGDVRVEDPEFLLTSGLLVVDLPRGTNRVEHIVAQRDVVILNRLDQSRATGERAAYSTRRGGELITLSGKPTWRDAQNEGRADVFIFDRTNRTVLAKGNALMRLPRGNMASLDLPGTATNNIDTNQLVDVSSDSFEIQLPTAQRPHRSLRAEGSVKILSPGDRSAASAERAFFEGARGLLTLQGDAAWQTEQLVARGDTLILDRTNQVFRVEKNARLRLRATGAATQAPAADAEPATEQWIEIQCESFEATTNAARFRKRVRADFLNSDAPGYLYCDALDLSLTNGQVETAFACGNVFFDQPPNTAVPTNQVHKTLRSELLTLKRSPITGLIEALVAQEDVILSQREATTNGVRTNILSAEMVSMAFARGSNALTGLIAERNVRITQGRNLVTGEKAVYQADEKSDAFEITGRPTAEVLNRRTDGTTERILISDAETLVMEPKTDKVRARGAFRITPLPVEAESDKDNR